MFLQSLKNSSIIVIEYAVYILSFSLFFLVIMYLLSFFMGCLATVLIIEANLHWSSRAKTQEADG
uniref:Uncharacterized protein n=1 Tax=Rhizophora mucronata TaxID=61149 RepID=A0A2P2QVC2_RHIMU